MALLQTETAEQGLEALDEEECLALLGARGVGRVAITMGAIPVVPPVNYCIQDAAIFFRTGDGLKLRAATDHTVIAFEVDEIDPYSREGWSVLAIGTAKVLTELDELRCIERLPLHPWAPGTRAHVVRMVPEFVSGRRIPHSIQDK